MDEYAMVLLVDLVVDIVNTLVEQHYHHLLVDMMVAVGKIAVDKVVVVVDRKIVDTVDGIVGVE